MPNRPSPLLVIAALVVVQILFGINYVTSKIVVGAFPPLIWASMRLACSAVLMVSIAAALGRPHPPKTRAFFVPLIGMALLGMIINQASFLTGLHLTTSTNSAILNTLIPLFTLLIVTIRGQERLGPKRMLGFVCAFIGVLSIRKIENLTLGDRTLHGDLLTILNCLSYSLFLSVSKGFLERNDRVWTTAWLFCYGTVGLTLIAIPDFTTFQMPPLDPRLIACMIFAVVGGTLLTYFLNIWALAYARSSSVALFIYLQPVVASLLAWFWFGEMVSGRTILSSVLIFIGVILALPKAETLAGRAPQTRG